MHYRISLSLLVMSGVLLSAPAEAQRRAVTLNAPSTGDLHATVLTDRASQPVINARRETVALSWVARATSGQGTRGAHRAESRHYTQRVRGDALAKGVELYTAAPGAVVRVSASKGRLDPLAFSVVSNGRRQTLAAVSDQLVDADNLRAAGLDSAATSVGARLTGASGHIGLRYDGQLDADAEVVVSVFDRQSNIVATAQSRADQFFDAANASVAVTWPGATGPVRWRGAAVSPDGRRYTLSFDDSGNGRMTQRVAPASAPGLWEWRVTGTDANGVVRDVSTAFTLTTAVAKLGEQVRIIRTPGGIDITVPVDVGVEGRYEVRAALTDGGTGGASVIAARAEWLAPGRSEITLRFAADHLKGAGLSSTMVLGDLTVTDQSRMSVQARRRHALTL
ncbi:MAG: DUF4785 domain-containing protein [Pseudomonadota bacterium]